MNNILLIGNGFDLAHGLPTSYNDFLYIMKNWSIFELTIKNLKRGEAIPTDDLYYKFFSNIRDLNEDNITKLGEIIKYNSWIQYYCSCEAEIDGWIDFEREIYPVINLFEKVFAQTQYDQLTRGFYTEAIITRSIFNAQEINIALLWPQYFEVDSKSVHIKAPFVSEKYGFLKKKILKSLRDAFDGFILAFEIYLHEFVYKKINVQKLKQIEDIKAKYVISFNYTLTEKIYGLQSDNTHHVHGMMREDLASAKNNMVVGVNEQTNQNMDFIYFVKYFQRIQKDAGVRYKCFSDMTRTNKMGETTRENYYLYIYGHSLDETDEDILKYIIGYIDEEGILRMKPRKVLIYYYDDFDYDQKVINLIKLYGRSIVEKYMEDKLFVFIHTTDEKCVTA